VRRTAARESRVHRPAFPVTPRLWVSLFSDEYVAKSNSASFDAGLNLQTARHFLVVILGVETTSLDAALDLQTATNRLIVISGDLLQTVTSLDVCFDFHISPSLLLWLTLSDNAALTHLGTHHRHSSTHAKKKCETDDRGIFLICAQTGKPGDEPGFLFVESAESAGF
jgi:hypothetical protein